MNVTRRHRSSGLGALFARKAREGLMSGPRAGEETHA